jgi:hypothetical protein
LFSSPDAVKIVDQSLGCCAALHIHGFLMLEANNRSIFDILPRLTSYHHPQNIIVLQGFIFHSFYSGVDVIQVVPFQNIL